MLIELKDIIKNYDNGGVITKVLRGVSLSVDEGEFVAIMGPSGSGKSTLMHTIGFLDKQTSGTYLFDGEDTSSFNDDELARIRNDRIGFVFQSFNLLPRTSVLDNVILPLLYNSSKASQEARAKKALESVGLGERIHFMSNQISGGQKQRVAIARALVCDPKVIFADEPTGNLDSKSGATVMNILERLNKEGRTIILVTHDKGVALHANRIVTISDGEIVSDVLIPEEDRIHSKEIKEEE
ncbi:MAG: ABC transporter related protein [Candidatus Nomurabacteria bacterium GW2011_GWF2_35_66]|uniref:ABC transporter related protein n=1 Tax=Candidatus Nomurabacteria bacterium GW2011_GWE1_35_16 TaxID=1618761 RepID=A0A0G0BAT3_9BACT|nr:MAG: ABC transporter related protein [Candidatus Nomurabacteria bacterium GW2011_GWF1_34_20]KKP63242.1 MAG: ABC transporter related protein [Candidatus Nomurabacteria bacterium GW2011_GWE2_34_25]KKP66444.1 MAG: ABC transporter related protein [Candidatus Nomurabacteria bacterium GW2011_GWE1_35_16]KKP83338.1 MAG: ABC transporter related protein [Candidatus Nomurabacteria bacterium GW2011_GWF2_35_66]HAE36479.1 macrolide ABC transporter ATP-binding protein [Candidatus Nomurabacteria bacterium]